MMLALRQVRRATGNDPLVIMTCYRRLPAPFPWDKIRQLRLRRVVGRSATCREIGRWIRRRLPPSAYENGGCLAAAPTVMSDGLAVRAVHDLRGKGIHTGFRLPAELVATLAAYARLTPCRREDGDGERFLFGEIREGLAPSGAPVAVADVDTRRPCPAIDRLSRDAQLLEIATRYFGYPPVRVEERLFWSPISPHSDETRRRNGQTIDFHYDIDRARSLYVYFYLTPTDRRSGAHVVLPTTHRRKPLSIVLASAFQSDARLRAAYPHVEPLIVEGDAGFGFVEDPACFHKVLAPQTADRLVLQLRYS